MLGQNIKWTCENQTDGNITFQNHSKDAVINRFSMAWENETIKIEVTKEPTVTSPSKNSVFEGAKGEKLDLVLREILAMDPTFSNILDFVKEFIDNPSVTVNTTNQQARNNPNTNTHQTSNAHMLWSKFFSNFPLKTLTPQANFDLNAVKNWVKSIVSTCETLIDDLKKQLALSNSLQVFFDLGSLLKLASPINLKRIISIISESKAKVISTLKDQEAMSNITLQISAYPLKLAWMLHEHHVSAGSQLKDTLKAMMSPLNAELFDQYLTQLAALSLTDALEAMIDHPGKIKALNETLFQLWFDLIATPDAKQILNALNIEDCVLMIEKDQQAMNGLEFLCDTISKLIKYTLNEPSIVDDLIPAMLDASKSTFRVGPVNDMTKVFDSINILTSQQLKTNLGALNRLKPIQDLQNTIFSDFISSLLYQRMLKNKEICKNFDAQYKLIKGTTMYEAYKASSPTIAACATKIEMDIANAASHVDVMTPEVVASQLQRQPAVLTNVKRAMNDEPSILEAESTIPSKRAKKPRKK